jgi:hypothetical protein
MLLRKQGMLVLHACKGHLTLDVMIPAICAVSSDFLLIFGEVSTVTHSSE